LPAERPEVASAPTRRSNRLRTALAVDGNSGVAAAPIPVRVESAPTAAQVESAATSRRARRLANAGAPAAQPVTEPAPQDLADEIVIVEIAPEAAPQAADVVEPATVETAASDVDSFAVASAAFGFAPVPDETSDAEPEAKADTTASGTHVAPRRVRRVRKVVAAGASLGVMGIAGLIAVSMTLPASAVAAVQGAGSPLTSLVAAKDAASATKMEEDDIQAFVASSGVQDDALARSDSFSTVSMAEVAAEEGINYSSEVFSNDSSAAIQWPFMVGVGMSYGYGMRSGRLHEGIDFVPGNGAPVQAIADGTVRIATEHGGAYGVTVYIDHVIDGQVITSHYAHMQYGSLRVQAGEKVAVGTVIGRTGNTGRSYGAHMHFEIIINGSTIDPLPWLRKNAGRYDGVTAP